VIAPSLARKSTGRPPFSNRAVELFVGYLARRAAGEALELEELARAGASCPLEPDVFAP